jgi:hypothetical protein
MVAFKVIITVVVVVGSRGIITVGEASTRAVVAAVVGWEAEEEVLTEAEITNSNKLRISRPESI